ncbi:MAG TPA: rod shape-determining protein RodA [Mycobacteriales bacterium]|jgi:rod shape determining protein RodA|nr:rod shape-determining protein RodA [Mycobacteriales bacterium]
MTSTTPRHAPYATRRRETVRSRALDRDSPLWRLDWTLLAAVFALVAAGAVLVWSATQESSYLKKDVINIGISLALGTVVALVDYRALRAYVPFVYLASCVGLVAVLSPLGSTINGSHSWIRLGGGFEVQPSEFAKVALIVGMAMLLGEKRDGENVPRDTDVLAVLGLAAVPLGLVLLQPDLGSVMVLVAILLGVLAISGARARWIVGLILLGIVGAFLVAHLHILKDYQLERFKAFANPTSGGSGYGYQTQQARIAIGAGGLHGTGLFQGSQTNGHFVPEQQTDFIFTVAGEELGFIGAGTLVLLTGVVLWRGLRIASQAQDMFGRLMATGVVCWLAFQSFENIGMSVGIMPLTGLPLPFVSYGGSSMFATFMAVGLLQSVHMRSRGS